jgi:ketosteroid isomerase-like protein
MAQRLATCVGEGRFGNDAGDADRDMVFLVPGQPSFGKKEFKAAWDGPMKGPRLESKADLEECIVSGNMACTRTRLAVAITTPDGNVSRASGYTLSFFRKQPDGRWLLARERIC